MQVPKHTLANGVEIPMIGFGTWKLKGQQCTDLVRYAIETGYRSIDTAAAYENEEFVGQGIKRQRLKTGRAVCDHQAEKPLSWL